jgi:hypothetical protein
MVKVCMISFRYLYLAQQIYLENTMLNLAMYAGVQSPWERSKAETAPMGEADFFE